MDFKSKTLTYIFVTLIALSILGSFYRFIILKDFIIEAKVDCDPQTESCFIWNCEPGVDCTGNPDEDTWYYKIVHRNAKNIPDCDPDAESCELYSCTTDEKDCEYILCDSAVDDCSSPVPVVDESESSEATTDEMGVEPISTENLEVSSSQEETTPNAE